MEKLREHLRNNVVGYLALFVALSGTAYAAVELGKNDVRSRHIKNGQVKVKDLASDAVSSPKVADGSLLGQDFAAGQLPQFKGAAAGGALTGTYPNPTLASPEPVHKIGDPGEPAFNAAVTNQSGGDLLPAGVYKDGFGRVFLQGTVHTTGPRTLFTLPAGYRPADTACTLAPGFDGPGTTLQFSRICVRSNGDVAYLNGAGSSYLSLDGISFRAAG